MQKLENQQSGSINCLKIINFMTRLKQASRGNSEGNRKLGFRP